jgi:hypothetical protein
VITVENLTPGDVIVWPEWYKRPDCEVTASPIHTFETVAPLAGLPCIRIPMRRLDTNEDGYHTFGPGAEVELREGL